MRGYAVVLKLRRLRGENLRDPVASADIQVRVSGRGQMQDTASGLHRRRFLPQCGDTLGAVGVVVDIDPFFTPRCDGAAVFLGKRSL